MTPRPALFAAAFAVSIACTRAGDRCATCGMKIDPSSPWRTELVATGVVRAFDTPRCALTAWEKGGRTGDVRVQEFYDRTTLSASDVRFITGSDVVGPMGAELVPVAPAHVAKFQTDHGGIKVVSQAELGAGDLR